MVVVSNYVLGHCVFVVSRCLLWYTFESSMAMSGVLFLIHCGLWIVATVFIVKLGCGCYPGLGVVAELFWPH